MGRKRGSRNRRKPDERVYFMQLANIINAAIDETAGLRGNHVSDAFMLVHTRLESFAALRPEHRTVLGYHGVFESLFAHPQFLAAEQIRDTLEKAVKLDSEFKAWVAAEKAKLLKPKTPVQLVAEAIFKVAQRKPQ